MGHTLQLVNSIYLKQDSFHESYEVYELDSDFQMYQLLSNGPGLKHHLTNCSAFQRLVGYFSREIHSLFLHENHFSKWSPCTKSHQDFSRTKSHWVVPISNYLTP